MKRCSKCGFPKPLSEYYEHPETADGHFAKCKKCTKDDVTDSRRKKAGCTKVKKVNKYHSEYRKKQNHRAASLVYNKKHADKKYARLLSRRAFMAGKIIQTPCERCGDAKSQMHHDDYTKPLQVRWLCKFCHEEYHKIHGDNLKGTQT